jgi:hypothetical protein
MDENGPDAGEFETPDRQAPGAGAAGWISKYLRCNASSLSVYIVSVPWRDARQPARKAR